MDIDIRRSIDVSRTEKKEFSNKKEDITMVKFLSKRYGLAEIQLLFYSSGINK